MLNERYNNPIIWSDFPDLDAIRVEETYYMISTTMHFMPGGVILRSYDLVNWEIISYVYDALEENDEAQGLMADKQIYGKGMWAASLRFHKGTFYVCFAANDTGKTYLYQSEAIEGPWRKSYIEGFYHDCSLLFDEDDRVYIVYGNKNIYLSELKTDLSGPKEGGIHKLIIHDGGDVILGYEGAHAYKINGKYYVCLIHWLKSSTRRRTQAVFMADSIDGKYIGKDVLNDDMGYYNAGVAQGGLVDTPEGKWFAMLFQDHGAVGRIPILVPVIWKDDFPVFGEKGKVPKELEAVSTRPEHEYSPLVRSDSFEYEADESGEVRLKKVWQWNHRPDHRLWSVTERPGHLWIKTGKLSSRIEQAQNILTQRTMGPKCSGEVTLSGGELKEGDFMGIAAFEGCYSFIALTKREGEYELVVVNREKDSKKEWQSERVKVEAPYVKVKAEFDFTNNKDEVSFFYENQKKWQQLGSTQKLYYLLDHFTGCRMGLFVYATQEVGGVGDFKDFIYEV